MSARDLLIEAAQHGLLIIPDGRNLRIRPSRLVTPDLADRLRANKPESLALLADQKAPELVKPHRPLTEREWAILVRAGAENDPIIISALNLFNATIVE